MESWELCPGATPHRTLGQARAVATWLNSQKGGKGRWRFRAATQPDGTHRVERTPNPEADVVQGRR